MGAAVHLQMPSLGLTHSVSQLLMASLRAGDSSYVLQELLSMERIVPAVMEAA